MIVLGSRYRKVLLSILLPLFCLSCFSYEEVEIKDIKDIQLVKFSEKGIILNTSIKINNPNNVGFKIVDSEFDIMIRNKRIGKAFIDNKIKIPANSNDYHLIVLETDHSDMNIAAMPGLLAMAIAPPEEIDFKAEGFVVGKVFLFRKKVKVDHQGIVPLKFKD